VRYVSLFVLVLLAGCKLDPIKIDPCSILPGGIDCYAIPLNQPDKEEYERPLNLGDVCVTSDEYAQLQKHFNRLMQKCGDRCK